MAQLLRTRWPFLKEASNYTHRISKVGRAAAVATSGLVPVHQLTNNYVSVPHDFVSSEHSDIALHHHQQQFCAPLLTQSRPLTSLRSLPMTAPKMVESHQIKRIGFIGAGQMASSLAKGIINKGCSKPNELLLSDVSPATLARMEELGCGTTTDNRKLVAESDVVILAVKPQVLSPILREVGPVFTPDKMLISIAAGVNMASLAEYLGRDDILICRVMPNVCCLVGAAASAFCFNKPAPEQEVYVKSLLEAVGTAHSVSETQIDAVTAVSGSGPAYAFMMIEAMADGGVFAGLPRDVAVALAAQTVAGAAKMVLETKQHPAALKDLVCSPAGTTIQACKTLEEKGFRDAVISAVDVCKKRSVELGKH